jgi:hypothetical protein
MKKLIALLSLTGLALGFAAVALAIDLPPVPGGVELPVPLQFVLLKLKADQLKDIDAGKDVTLRPGQIKKVKKEFKDFDGTTAKINKDHVVMKKVVVTLKDGKLESFTMPDNIPGMGKGKGKGQGQGQNQNQGPK